MFPVFIGLLLTGVFSPVSKVTTFPPPPLRRALVLHLRLLYFLLWIVRPIRGLISNCRLISVFGSSTQQNAPICDSWKGGVLALTAVSVPVSAMAVKAGGGSDLHLQLLALGGVCWRGVAVVRPQSALALSPHRLRQLIGCVRFGAPAAQELRRDTHVRLTGELPWQQMGRGHSSPRSCVSEEFKLSGH